VAHWRLQDAAAPLITLQRPLRRSSRLLEQPHRLCTLSLSSQRTTAKSPLVLEPFMWEHTHALCSTWPAARLAAPRVSHFPICAAACCLQTVESITCEARSAATCFQAEGMNRSLSASSTAANFWSVCCASASTAFDVTSAPRTSPAAAHVAASDQHTRCLRWIFISICHTVCTCARAHVYATACHLDIQHMSKMLTML
jgi:hypothetical protein